MLSVDCIIPNLTNEVRWRNSVFRMYRERERARGGSEGKEINVETKKFFIGKRKMAAKITFPSLYF